MRPRTAVTARGPQGAAGCGARGPGRGRRAGHGAGRRGDAGRRVGPGGAGPSSPGRLGRRDPRGRAPAAVRAPQSRPKVRPQGHLPRAGGAAGAIETTKGPGARAGGRAGAQRGPRGWPRAGRSPLRRGTPAGPGEPPPLPASRSRVPVSELVVLHFLWVRRGWLVGTSRSSGDVGTRPSGRRAGGPFALLCGVPRRCGDRSILS